VIPGYHQHAVLSGDGINTSKVSPFSKELVKRWAQLYRVYVNSPDEMTCLHCADTASKPELPAVPAKARRVLERCLRASQALVVEVPESVSDSESESDTADLFEGFELLGSEAVLRVNLHNSSLPRLGARCDPPSKISKTLPIQRKGPPIRKEERPNSLSGAPILLGAQREDLENEESKDEMRPSKLDSPKS
jgi:hypothetical protein